MCELFHRSGVYHQYAEVKNAKWTFRMNPSFNFQPIERNFQHTKFILSVKQIGALLCSPYSYHLQTLAQYERWTHTITLPSTFTSIPHLQHDANNALNFFGSLVLFFWLNFFFFVFYFCFNFLICHRGSVSLVFSCAQNCVNNNRQADSFLIWSFSFNICLQAVYVRLGLLVIDFFLLFTIKITFWF